MIKKILCSVLLLGLGLVGFSYGTYSAHPIGAITGNPYQVSVNTKGNVLTTYSDITNYVFAPSNNVVFFWDILSNPRLIALDTDGWVNTCKNRSQYVYYYICDEIPDSNFTDITNCTKESIDKVYLSDFLNSVGSSDNFAYEYSMGYNEYRRFNLCFSSKSKGKSICFKYQGNQGANHRCYLGSDMTGSVLDYNFSNIPDSLIGKSPANPYTSVDDSDFSYIDSTLTNYEVILGCEKLGLEYSYCKGGYDSSVLFPDSGFPSLANYVRGQGVDIITMYNMYSGFYNTPNKFMQAISKGYNIHDYDWFRGKPLALYMFAVQYFPNKDDLQFSFMDIYDYCQLYDDLLEGSIEVYMFDNLQVCKNQARIDKVNNFTNGITIDGSGAISIFGNGTGFTNPDDFFGKIYSFFNTNLIYDGESYPGVLPPVIYFFMIAIIFIRIISRSNG